MEWKKVKLGEVLTIKYGKDHKALGAGNIPVYGSGGIMRYADKAIYEKPSILIPRKGSLNNIFYVDKPFWTVDTMFWSIIDTKKADPHFLFYAICKLDFAGLNVGSAVPSLTVPVIEAVELPLPPLETQRRIAAILSCLDDKIENNNRINRNLEAQAQALFKSWFVDFEPWGGIMPEDWKETTIGEMCTCYLGGTPSRAKSEYWNGDIPWINSGEVNKYRIVEGSEYITELGLKKSATKLLPKKTIVLAITGATLGQVSLLEIDACANQSVIGILENEKMPYEFIYPLIVNDIDKIILNQTGGAQQHINKDNVASHNIIIPTDEIMAKYKTIQAPLFETIANNCLESHRLAALRDTLLPKLMKGEITL